MKRWIKKDSEHGEKQRVDRFLADIAAVCEKHQLSISHEDTHGGFEVVEFDKHFIDWLMEAKDSTAKKPCG